VPDQATIRAAADAAVAEINPTGDIHGSTEYRKQLLRVMTERAINEALTRVEVSQ
jgi:CO/xanthine dehydrogenase FAD-binding subunit